MEKTRTEHHLPEILAVREDREADAARQRGSAISSDALSVYLEGGPRYRLNDRTYDFTPPMAMLITEGTFDGDRQEDEIYGVFALFRGHGLVTASQEDQEQVHVSLQGTRIAVPCFKELSKPDAQEIAGLLDKMAALGDGNTTGRLRRVSLLLEAIARYAEAGSRSADAGIHREALRLRSMIEAWALETVNMTRIYQELDISADHAGLLFRQAFGTSPVAYRNQLRLNRARELLVSSKLNVSQVAYFVGFTDPLYFSRVFHREFHVAPSSLITDFDTTRK